MTRAGRSPHSVHRQPRATCSTSVSPVSGGGPNVTSVQVRPSSSDRAATELFHCRPRTQSSSPRSATSTVSCPPRPGRTDSTSTGSLNTTPAGYGSGGDGGSVVDVVVVAWAVVDGAGEVGADRRVGWVRSTAAPSRLGPCRRNSPRLSLHRCRRQQPSPSATRPSNAFGSPVFGSRQFLPVDGTKPVSRADPPGSRFVTPHPSYVPSVTAR